MNLQSLLATCCATVALTACAAMVPRPGDAELAAGVRIYESGRFADAAQFLQRSLDLGLDDAERLVAHKYLAFIYCVSEREAQCRSEFRLVLAIQPAFELEPAEAGHPTWGPVFRNVKASL